jgi:hypothetical protein
MDRDRTERCGFPFGIHWGKLWAVRSTEIGTVDVDHLGLLIVAPCIWVPDQAEKLGSLVG